MCTVYAVVLVTILSLSLTLYSAFPRWVCLMGSALCLLVRSKTRSFKIIAWEKNKIASENVHNEIVFSAHSNTYTTYRCAHTLQVNRFQLSGKIGSSSFRIIRTFEHGNKNTQFKSDYIGSNATWPQSYVKWCILSVRIVRWIDKNNNNKKKHHWIDRQSTPKRKTMRAYKCFQQLNRIQFVNTVSILIDFALSGAHSFLRHVFRHL